jgi:hypothetical protein
MISRPEPVNAKMTNDLAMNNEWVNRDDSVSDLIDTEINREWKARWPIKNEKPSNRNDLQTFSKWMDGPRVLVGFRPHS